MSESERVKEAERAFAEGRFADLRNLAQAPDLEADDSERLRALVARTNPSRAEGFLLLVAGALLIALASFWFLHRSSTR